MNLPVSIFGNKFYRETIFYDIPIVTVIIKNEIIANLIISNYQYNYKHFLISSTQIQLSSLHLQSNL